MLIIWIGLVVFQIRKSYVNNEHAEVFVKQNLQAFFQSVKNKDILLYMDHLLPWTQHNGLDL
jgi:hypothetical protein